MFIYRFYFLIFQVQKCHTCIYLSESCTEYHCSNYKDEYVYGERITEPIEDYSQSKIEQNIHNMLEANPFQQEHCIRYCGVGGVLSIDGSGTFCDLQFHL